MRKYLLRLDDASPKRDVAKWDKMETLLDKYGVKPLVGIIPDCKDPDFEKYPFDKDFWMKRIYAWKQKNWIFAMHGYEHVFHTKNGGINPVNKYSEFAGLSFEEQSSKIVAGLKILRLHNIEPKVFFAPAHTFDKNTIKSLLEKTSLRIISDMPANKPFQKYGLTFIPQQSGKVRELPFTVQTFCYHPNTMQDKDFEELEAFLQNHKFSIFPLQETNRTPSLYDILLMKIYYWRHR